MPTYEYKCTDCGHVWETEQRVSDLPLTSCPVCGKETAKRLISLTSFVLAGGCWASDGYAST